MGPVVSAAFLPQGECHLIKLTIQIDILILLELYRLSDAHKLNSINC